MCSKRKCNLKSLNNKLEKAIIMSQHKHHHSKNQMVANHTEEDNSNLIFIRREAVS